MISLRKHFPKLLCIVVACITLASVFIVVMAQEDGTPVNLDMAVTASSSPTANPDTQETVSADALLADEAVSEEPTADPSSAEILAPSEMPQGSPMPSATPAYTPEESTQPDATSAPSTVPVEEPEAGESSSPHAGTTADAAASATASVEPSATPTQQPEASVQPEATPSPSAEPGEEADAIEIELPPEESETEPIPEYPPAWVESGQAYIKGNLLVAEQTRLLQGALQARIRVIRRALAMPENVSVTYDPDNMIDVFAIYAVRHGMANDFPYNVKIDSQAARDELSSIFWDLTHVNGTVKTIGGQKDSSIHISRSSFADGQVRWALSTAQKEAIKGLITTRNASALKSQLNDSILSILTDSEFARAEEELRNVAGERRAVLLAALSLQDKVRYFWGGKSYYVGWDNRWGQMRTVTSEGSNTTGSALPFGMDCSGFVSWSFINADGNKEMLRYIGNGSANQWRNSKAIEWNEIQPGDIVFYENPVSIETNHVGIVLGKDAEGKLRIVHCSGSRGGVVVTGAAGFKYARRPYIY